MIHRRLLSVGLAMLTVVLMLLVMPAAGNVSHAQGTPAPLSPDAQGILEQAQKASADAANAINLLNTMLQFIQVGGLIGGALIAIGGFALAVSGLRTIADYRTQLDAVKARYDQEVGAALAEVQRLRDQLMNETQRAQETVVGMDQRFNQANEEATRAVRALALLQLGEQQMEARNMRAALQTFEEAYAYDPENRATNYFLGEMYIQQRDIEKGIAHLEKTRNERGDYYPPAQAALAYAIRLQGERQADVNRRNALFAQAEQHFLAALENDPTVRDINNESFHGVLGGLYRRQRRVDDAIRAYLQAEKVTPYNAYPANNLALLYYGQGKLEEAQQYFEKTIRFSRRELESKPNDFWSHFNIITAEVALNDNAGALQEVDQVLATDPGYGPLESLMSGLLDLANAPRPPADMRPVVSRIQAAIEAAKKAKPATG